MPRTVAGQTSHPVIQLTRLEVSTLPVVGIMKSVGARVAPGKESMDPVTILIIAFILFVLATTGKSFVEAERYRREDKAIRDQRRRSAANRAAAVKRSQAKAQAWAAHGESVRLLAEDEADAEQTDEWTEANDMAVAVSRLQVQDDGCPF